MNERDKSSLLDMIEAAQTVFSFMDGADLERLENDKLLQSAVIRQFEILGEAANRIQKDVQKQYPEIPWGEIIGMRNILIHGYDEIELEFVWKAYKNDLSQLLETLQKIFKSL